MSVKEIIDIITTGTISIAVVLFVIKDVFIKKEKDETNKL
jgi:hypothetical protein